MAFAVAAGNLTDPSLEVLLAAADGSQVGAVIAFCLAEEHVRDTSQRSGAQAEWDDRYGRHD